MHHTVNSSIFFRSKKFYFHQKAKFQMAGLALVCRRTPCTQCTHFECLWQMLLRCSHLSTSFTVDAAAPTEEPELGLEIINDDLDVDD